MEFQNEELNEILNIFQQESAEIISSMDEKLLVLEREENNPDIAIQLFRDAHSLKGSARMLGFDDIQNIAHKIEDIISLVRENKIVLTSKATDVISECLSFISVLINKTVEQKEEFKSPQTSLYIEKLVDIINDKSLSVEKETVLTDEKKEFIEEYDKIEKDIIDVLFIISNSALTKKYDDISKIGLKLSSLLFLFEKYIQFDFVDLKKAISNILSMVEKFQVAENKPLAFLDLNTETTAFFELLFEFFKKEQIERINYYDVIDEKLNDKSLSVAVSDDKLISKIILLETNIDFAPEVIEEFENLIKKEENPKNRVIYQNIIDLINVYKSANVTINQDIRHAILEIMDAIKTQDYFLIEDALRKSDVIKIMAKFLPKDEKPPKRASDVQNQKDILNTITNTEIKTLRIESSRLDNLVGQIGELIVSKIKTNDQMSLAKKITNDLIDWQKQFVKMGYYIKYFDKKYLSNPNNPVSDNRKLIAYNKQLSALYEFHEEKVSSLIKETSDLFKQLQESETKLNSTTLEIENMVRNMRILPLSVIFTLFPRMVHNIARDKNKKIDFIINGADVTADKTIIEEIKIPLMHIIRNSIDHGIEDAKTREALGKNPVGKIEINASYVDNKVIIDVKDDGRGLDIEKIKAKALEKKLLTREEIESIKDEELTNLIFYPGFSTENFVTEISGRGLGLDIVNNKINQLNGRVDIYSQVNKGTLTRLILPATVATRKVFIIEEQEQFWAIETSVIKTILRIHPDEIFEKDGKNYFIYDNSAIEVHCLSQILNFENVKYDSLKFTLMIIETENICFGLIVQKLISDQEIVHKKLSPPLYKVKHILGITTLANGEACLILSISDIIATINSKKLKNRIAYKNNIVKMQDFREKRILVVDDSHTTRIMQKNILSSHGYSVSSATDPIKALLKLREEEFDLIITDIEMPDMNGFEFIAEARKLPQYKNVPIIILSSLNKDKNIAEIEKSHAVAYIQKSNYRQQELLDYIKEIFN